MKNSSALMFGTAVLFCTWAGASLAQDAKAPPPKPAAAAAQSDPSMDMSSRMARMDEHMKKMQALHEKVASAATPEERQRAMAEQRQEMQRCMDMMKPMVHGGGMMDGKGGGMMDQKTPPADARTHMKMMQEHMDMMQKRLDMMQLMMQSMMDQQDMMNSPGSRDGQHNH